MYNYGGMSYFRPDTQYGAGLSLSPSDDTQQLWGVTAVPEGIASGSAITVKVVWMSEAATTQWRARGEFHAVAHGEWLGDLGISGESATATLTINGTQDVLQIHTLATITTSGSMANHVIFFDLERDLAHADDTTTLETAIFGLLFEYTADS